MKKLMSILLIACIVLITACGPIGSTTDPAASPESPGASPASPGASSASPGASSTSPNATPANPGASPDHPGASPAPTDEGVKFAEHIEIILDNMAPAAVNPFSPAGSSVGSNWTYRMIYDTLIYPLGNGEYAPLLATQWETQDFQTYVFNLRDDVYFHNGDNVTANDVAFTVNVLSKEFVGTPGANRWSAAETATATDKYTVEIVLKSVNVDFLYEISTSQAGIFSEKEYQENPDEWAYMGSGPFILKGFTSNDSIELERNDNYWGDIPVTKSVTMRYIPEMAARLMMLQNNEADACFAITPEDVPAIEANPDFEVYWLKLNNPHLLGFNLDDPIVGDLNFRLAVAHALYREDIAIVSGGDGGVPVTDGSTFGYDQEFRNWDVPLRPYDPDLAREYLAASVYNGEEIEIAAAIPTLILGLPVIQQQLADVGIKTRINQMDIPGLGAYAAYGNNQCQIIYYVPNLGHGVASIQTLYLPGGNMNRMSFNDPYVTELLTRAQTIGDYNERRELYMGLQEYLNEEPAMVGTYWHANPLVFRKGIGGMKLRTDDLHDLRGIYLIID